MDERGHVRHVHGRAVQLDPIKPTLKPTGTKRLKLKWEMLLSISAFKFNLRRYIMVLRWVASRCYEHYLRSRLFAACTDPAEARPKP
jgi:hypothetical protein